MISLAYTGQDLASGVKVSIEQARAAALNAVPGTINPSRPLAAVVAKGSFV
jgi:hypothetical protein